MQGRPSAARRAHIALALNLTLAAVPLLGITAAQANTALTNTSRALSQLDGVTQVAST